MRKTLEAMYYDNLSIAGRGLDKKSEYYKAERAVCEIACELEDGSATLDKSLDLYNEGIKLIKSANTMLDSAEKKIKLAKKDGEDSK